MSEKVEKTKILVEVLGEYYTEGNAQLLFRCPKCEHHKRKLSVNVEKNLFKCWVCDYSGRNIYRLVKRYGSYTNKREWAKFGLQTEIKDFNDKLFGLVEEEAEESIKLPKNFISLVNKKLPSTASAPLNYLESRGITKADITRWKIGYCSIGKYGGRVIIPSFSTSGAVNYFVSRSYDNNWKKYLNPKAGRNIIFNDLYLDFDEDLVLVEGAFDAIKAGENSVPLLGSTLTETSPLFQKIVGNDTAVYLALDSDASKKANKIIKLFLKYDIELFRIDCSPYNDVGEMPKHVFKDKKQTAVFLNSNNYLLNKVMGI